MTNMQVLPVSWNSDTIRRLLALLLLALSLQFVAASCESDDIERAAQDQYERMNK